MESQIGNLWKIILRRYGGGCLETSIPYSRIELNISKWKEFKVCDIFECATSKHLDINNAENGNIAYVTRSALNNGISGFYGNEDKKIKGNCITIGAEGIIAFYQENDFIPGVKIYTIRYDKINKYNALFICTILNLKKDLYSYGRARILEKIKNEFIMLPSNELNEPDWTYMEGYIKKLQFSDLI